MKLLAVPQQPSYRLAELVVLQYFILILTHIELGRMRHETKGVKISWYR